MRRKLPEPVSPEQILADPDAYYKKAFDRHLADIKKEDAERARKGLPRKRLRFA